MTPARRALLFLFVAAIGFAATLGALLTHHDAPGFVKLGEFWLWALLVGALVSACVITAPRILDAIHTLGPHASEHRSALTVAAVVFLSLVAAPHVAFPTSSPLSRHSLRIGIITVVVGAVAVASVVSMWLVHAAVEDAESRLATKNDVPSAINRYLDLRERLRSLLLVAGGIIGGATLARGALRNTVLAFCQQAEEARNAFPADLCGASGPATSLQQEYIVAYGLYLSLVLGAAYFPIALSLGRWGASIRQLAVGAPPGPDADTLSKWAEQRETIGGLLSLELNAKNSFANGVSILAPLVGSLLSLLGGK